MIFAESNHIELILEGNKTQTRRQSNRYQVGKLYAIQPSRTSKGIPDGKIKIVDKECEVWPVRINHDDAIAEGNYTPDEYEKLYSKMHPEWGTRYAYTFRFVPTRSNN